MHIEPGALAPAKVLYANAAAVTTVAGVGLQAVKSITGLPLTLAKTALASLVFTVLMQIWHLPVGPSELHLIGASAIYLLFGFVPTALGFVFGLALQGLLFEPQDLVHLGVNSLSLIVPLIGAHYAFGRRLHEGARLTWSEIVKLDALYYGGVTAMVGFWLLLGETATPVADWLAFAGSYAALVLCEPAITLGAVVLAKRGSVDGLVARFTEAARLSVAR